MEVTVIALAMALLYARLDETEDALSWLEKAVRQRGGLMVFAKVFPGSIACILSHVLASCWIGWASPIAVVARQSQGRDRVRWLLGRYSRLPTATRP